MAVQKNQFSTKNQTAEDSDQQIIAAKTALVDMVRAQISLYSFLEQAWPYIHGPGCEFIGGWPIEALSEHLEALVRGDIRKLIINVPPRTGKTSLVSIALVPWYWLIDPGKKFLYCSYEHGLSMGHSTLCRQLIDSHFYQERWGDRYQLSKDQNTQYCFANNHYGERRAVSVNGANTGHGGDILICDDPNNAHDVNSEKSREATNAWFSQVWSTRLNNPKTGSMLVVQQRVHDRDVTGHILASSLGKEWVHLFLPNEYEVYDDPHNLDQ